MGTAGRWESRARCRKSRLGNDPKHCPHHCDTDYRDGAIMRPRRGHGNHALCIQARKPKARLGPTVKRTGASLG